MLKVIVLWSDTLAYEWGNLLWSEISNSFHIPLHCEKMWYILLYMKIYLSSKIVLLPKVSGISVEAQMDVNFEREKSIFRVFPYFA
jgi:hypothetical protein